MSSHRLLGITTPDRAVKLLLLPAFQAARIEIVNALGLSALLLPDPKPKISWLKTRKAEMEGLLGFQKLLEATVGVAPVLPAAYGSARIDLPQALALLTAHARTAAEAFGALGSRIQFQIETRWNPQAALKAMRERDQLSDLPPETDRKRFGEALQSLMEAERLRMRMVATERLRSVASDLVQLPLGDETSVLNVAVLIERLDEPVLDAVVGEIDAMMPELSIRYLGPLPPVSFANIAIEAPESGTLARAHLTLGTKADASVEAIKQAYRELARLAHPDAGGQGDAEQMAALSKAQSLALSAAMAPRSGKGEPLLLDIRREGDRSASWAA